MAKIQHGCDLTGEEMVEMLDEFCNASGQDKFDEFTKQLVFGTHRTVQQKICRLFLACIEAWADDKAGHDLRNEATVRICKKIVAATGDKYDRCLPSI